MPATVDAVVVCQNCGRTEDEHVTALCPGDWPAHWTSPPIWAPATVDNVTGPAYSFTREQAGLLPLVLSIACAEGRHEDCRATFRCDCEHHRRTA